MCRFGLRPSRVVMCRFGLRPSRVVMCRVNPTHSCALEIGKSIAQSGAHDAQNCRTDDCTRLGRARAEAESQRVAAMLDAQAIFEIFARHAASLLRATALCVSLLGPVSPHPSPA